MFHESWIKVEQRQEVIQNINDEIWSDGELAHYVRKLTIFIADEESPFNLGKVLSHKFPEGYKRPIKFASKTLSPTEQRYS